MQFLLDRFAESPGTTAFVDHDRRVTYGEVLSAIAGYERLLESSGVPQGAVLIPLGDLESRAASELAADRPAYVICRSGNRSRTGSDILVGLGFAEAYNVDGGVTAWLDAGLPVETYQP